MTFFVRHGAAEHEVRLPPEGSTESLTIDGKAHPTELVDMGEAEFLIRLDGQQHLVRIERHADPEAPIAGPPTHVRIESEGRVWSFEVLSELQRKIRSTSGAAASAARGQTVRAPMPCRVSQVRVSKGDAVAAGQALVVIEAMKMESEIRATAAGVVHEVKASPGHLAAAGEVLLVIG